MLDLIFCVFLHMLTQTTLKTPIYNECHVEQWWIIIWMIRSAHLDLHILISLRMKDQMIYHFPMHQILILYLLQLMHQYMVFKSLYLIQLMHQ